MLEKWVNNSYSWKNNNYKIKIMNEIELAAYKSSWLFINWIMYLHNWYSLVLFHYHFSHDVPSKLEWNGSLRGVYSKVLCNKH